jgi:diguanylate cyclase (GGDEF)-like protein/PAS domain S-box-containing protein
MSRTHNGCVRRRAISARQRSRPGPSGLLPPLDRGLTVSQDDLRTILNALPAMVGYWDVELRNQMANDAYVEYVGLTPQQLRGMHISDVQGPETFAKHHPHMLRALAGEPQVFDGTLVDPSGRTRYTQVCYTPDVVDGEVRGFFVLVTDVSSRRIAEEAMQAADARFRTLFEFAPIGMFLTDPEGLVLDVNRAGAELLGGTRATLTGTPVAAFTHPEDRESSREHLGRLMAGEIDSYRLEKRYLHADGHVVWAQLDVTALHDGTGQGLIALALIQDVSERRNYEAQLRDLADRDALSGLLNHRAFMAEAERQAASATRYDVGGVLLLLDLDGFKQVNDMRGHQAGDEYIVRVATLLRQRVRVTDTVGRLGGDEFAIVLPQGDLEHARQLGEALLTLVRGDPEASGPRVAVSIGAAAFAPGRSAAAVVAAADAAMYRAKGAGGDRVAVEAS